jgi:hypothetical protein
MITHVRTVRAHLRQLGPEMLGARARLRFCSGVTMDLPGTTPARRRLSAAARTRMTIAFMLAGCLALIGVAVSGRASEPAGLQFVQVGHWVYSDAFQGAFHVNGTTSQVDARANVPGAEQGSQVAQGDRSGYVVERGRISVFDKSTLSVENAVTPPATETPVVLEVAGGPYLVYRNAGQIVRLGDPMATIPAGGPLSRPVVTTTGTVWLHRVDTGSVCELPRDATRLSCPAQLPPGHDGSVALVGDRPVLLDITADTLRPVGKDGLGEAIATGVKLSPTAQVANNAVEGRLAVVDPDRNQLHLIDTGGLDETRPVAKPVSVDLPKDSRFAGPVTTSHVVALVDETRNELLTYDSSGSLKSTKKVSGEGKPPRLAQGEDNRIYVDSPDGSHVLVVDGEDGSVAEASVDNAARGQTTSAAPPGSQPPTSTGSAPPPTTAAPPPVAAATSPGAPGKVNAVAGDGSAKVTWAAAAENGARVTAYHLSWPGGSTRVGGSARSATVTGLTNGTSYVITVVAENSAGGGAGASAKAVIPGRAADAPKVTANAAAGQVSVTWTGPDLHGATLQHYLVSATGQRDRQVSGTATNYQGMSGAVTITVRAVTRYGASPVLSGAPGKQTVTVPTQPPTVKITSVRSVSGGLIVTVNADGKGSPATCQATFVGVGATSGSVSCSGVTDMTIPVASWFGAPTITATIKNPAGSGTDSWTGVPTVSGGGGGSGGYLFLIGPVALVGARRGKDKEQS